MNDLTYMETVLQQAREALRALLGVMSTSTCRSYDITLVANALHSLEGIPSWDYSLGTLPPAKAKGT